MKYKKRAAFFVLSDTDEESVEWKLQDLENAKEDELAAMIVNVWYPFENFTVIDLLKTINELAEDFKEYNKKSDSVINRISNIISYDDKDEDEKLQEMISLIKAYEK